MGQQLIYREGAPGSAEGLTLWLAVAYQPQESINHLPVFLSSGAVYEGLLPGRDADTAALAVYHGELSDDLEDTGSETVLELNYTFWGDALARRYPRLSVCLPSGRPQQR